MPNHIHILLIIGEKPDSDQVGTYGNTSLDKDALPRVPTETLGSIIRQIKSRVTKYANQNNIIFARQGRYHDHIIRNENEYNRIKYYIQTNPQQRNDDKLNT